VDAVDLVWDMDASEATPDFESMDEANRVLSLIMRHYNTVVRQFTADPSGFELLYWKSALHSRKVSRRADSLGRGPHQQVRTHDGE
jgi:hypothetical protein